MPCYSPLHGFKGEINENGRRPILWKAPFGSERQDVPCGKCVGCRLAYSKNMAIRCMHESEMHKDNSFITLTFDDDHVPKDGYVDIRHVQLFMKRFRKLVSKPLRYFFAGEYGGKYGRPHYHGLIFGYDFPDKVLVKERMGNRLYQSKELASLWPFGFHSVGDVSFASAAYVARYCVKKADGKHEYFRDENGKRMQVEKSTGVVQPAEFTLMSRNPGIGSTWFDKFRDDVYPSDFLVVNGGKAKPPRYYDYLLDKADSELLESLKLQRSQKVDWRESTLDRLMVKEEVKLAKIKSLKRTLED